MAPRAWAEEGQRIIGVEIGGTKTIAKETILAKVQTKPGMSYQDSIVSEDIRRIFSLGYFTDVKAEVEKLPEGLKLVFRVKEKPTLLVIDLEGMRALSKQKIRPMLGITVGSPHNPAHVKEGIDRIQAEYERRGFSQCKVISRIQVDETANTANLFLIIDEGPRMRIRQILVEGNQSFSDGKIHSLLKTKRKGWIHSGVYQQQVIEEDLERVRAFYRKHGYQDIQVSHAIYRDPSGAGLIIHISVQEADQYRVGQVALEGSVLFPEREILQILKLKPGSIYYTEALQEDLRAIKEYYGDRGHIHAEVSPDPRMEGQPPKVHLVYHITEGSLVHVHSIDVRGNLRTKDKVVRRELRIYPGEPFDGAKIRKSVDRLYNLGYFEEVNVETEPTSLADREDLIVRVTEAKTGSFSFGGGFSSVDRLVGLLELEQRNFDLTNFPTFTGAGQDLRLKIEAGTVRRYFDLSFTEPWILDHPLSFGIDAYSRTRLRSRNLGLAFEEQRQGGGLRLGKEFNDVLQINLGYQLFRTEISDIIADASADLLAEQGRSDISMGSVSVALDRRNNRFDPSQGFYLGTDLDMAGGFFAGDRDFFRLQTVASHYLPHWERLVFESRVQAGWVDAYGDSSEVPIFERFFGGGAGTVRGFRERRVGPLDPNSNDPIGGEAIFVGSLEEVATLVTNDRGKPILRGSVFLDVGNVWRRVSEFGESFKAGTGVGARVTTPIGPLRLDVGIPITNEEGEDSKIRFHFNISRSF